ncbi:MAG TPA: hypothetical protein VFN67_17140 [Polyangiales bacterium]|nr:hypothetical protein [Polyangiales bacterium]
MKEARPQRTALALLCLSLWLGSHQPVRADDSPLSLRIQLDAGVGTHSSSLPGVNGTRRIDPAWFPLAGFRLMGLQAYGAPLRFGAELTYVSSTAFEVSRALEQGHARAQELNVLGRVAFALDDRPKPILVPISLGYGFDAFTTDIPLGGAQPYLLSGPRVAVGIELPLWAERVNIAGRVELGANITDTAALRSAGASGSGVQYAFQAEADVQLTELLRLGVRFRQAEAQLPVSSSGSFHEQRRFILASLMLRSPR